MSEFGTGPDFEGNKEKRRGFELLSIYNEEARRLSGLISVIARVKGEAIFSDQLIGIGRTDKTTVVVNETKIIAEQQGGLLITRGQSSYKGIGPVFEQVGRVIVGPTGAIVAAGPLKTLSFGARFVEDYEFNRENFGKQPKEFSELYWNGACLSEVEKYQKKVIPEMQNLYNQIETASMVSAYNGVPLALAVSKWVSAGIWPSDKQIEQWQNGIFPKPRPKIIRMTRKPE